MATFQPRRIPGRWREGYALDLHTVSAEFVGDDEFGHPRFNTIYTEVGKLLYRLKNGGDTSVIPELVAAAAGFVESWQPNVDLIIPVPATRERKVQPVSLLAEGLSERLGIPLASDCVTRVRNIPQLKDVHRYDERLRLLDGAHEVKAEQIVGKAVLLFDDLYRSGATDECDFGNALRQGWRG